MYDPWVPGRARYCAADASALQNDGFKAADPNGNGLCSLAECETFLLKALVRIT